MYGYARGGEAGGGDYDELYARGYEEEGEDSGGVFEFVGEEVREGVGMWSEGGFLVGWMGYANVLRERRAYFIPPARASFAACTIGLSGDLAWCYGAIRGLLTRGGFCVLVADSTRPWRFEGMAWHGMIPEFWCGCAQRGVSDLIVCASILHQILKRKKT